MAAEGRSTAAATTSISPRGAEDTLAVSLGRQHLSQKETSPCYSFGTGTRQALNKKSFMSREQFKTQTLLQSSPGPVYAKPTTTGQGPRHVFGTEERSPTIKPEYPDSSIDVMGATVDSQHVKYHSTKSVVLGTEARSNMKNGEVVRNNPSVMLGMESPAAFEHTPQEAHTVKKSPEYSFGPSGGMEGKKVPPLKGLTGASPRTLGPGSHRLPSGIGQQPKSSARTAPSYGFGTTPRLSARRDHPQILDLSPDLSSLGRQVVSKSTSNPSAVFGKCTRDQLAKSNMCYTQIDKGPAGSMPPIRHSLKMPAPPTKASKVVGCAL